ncbi:hypothetical protein JZX86_27510 [Agrobacterium rosae]|uniref:hypothetical protein n=1 Tax=Agrobacterium rosae TaxID=1972867 RepID=UPI0019D338DC|nr:hypothetical protein [Agrobacterium rosae]MBN7809071.1 hypothetical protein [Agrobacterium rosae]
MSKAGAGAKAQRLLNGNFNMKFMSIGENCQVAGQLRRTIKIKTTYFDNLVTPIDGLLQTLNRGVYKPMTPDCFEVGVWEGLPSARELSSGVFFHHEFFDEHAISPGRETLNIPQYIDHVNEKFKFLSDRFLAIARNSGKKCFVRRQYTGQALDADKLLQVQDALTNLGAKNFSVVNIHNSGDYPGLVVERGIHFYCVPSIENTNWLGNNAGWSDAILAVASDMGALR